MVDAPGLCSLALGCQQCITTPAHRAPTPQPKHKPRTTTTEWMHRCWPMLALLHSLEGCTSCAGQIAILIPHAVVVIVFFCFQM